MSAVLDVPDTPLRYARQVRDLLKRVVRGLDGEPDPSRCGWIADDLSMALQDAGCLVDALEAEEHA